ncbi:MAG: hypothetical protein MUO21_11700, partial [Nitrososphaeraceae archaeon]|nr:hypothetical protein [Nitrososphaeraceae archaeon]
GSTYKHFITVEDTDGTFQNMIPQARSNDMEYRNKLVENLKDCTDIGKYAKIRNRLTKYKIDPHDTKNYKYDIQFGLPPIIKTQPKMINSKTHSTQSKIHNNTNTKIQPNIQPKINTNTKNEWITVGLKKNNNKPNNKPKVKTSIQKGKNNVKSEPLPMEKDEIKIESTQPVNNIIKKPTWADHIKKSVGL